MRGASRIRGMIDDVLEEQGRTVQGGRDADRRPRARGPSPHRLFCAKLIGGLELPQPGGCWKIIRVPLTQTRRPRPPLTPRVFARIIQRMPSAVGVQKFAAFAQDAIDNQAFAARGKLRMPVLAIGAESHSVPPWLTSFASSRRM